MNRLKFALTIGSSLVFLMGWAIRLTLKDHFSQTAVLYYATPLGVLAFAGLFASYGWSFIVCRRSVAQSFLAASILTTALLVVSCVRLHLNSREVNPEDSVRVLVWNTARGHLGLQQVFRKIDEYDAEIVAIVEAGKDNFAKWEQAFDDYEVVTKPGGQLLIMSRRPIGDSSNGTIHVASSDTGGKFLRAEILIDHQTLNVCVVDISSDPFMDRHEFFSRLSTQIEPWLDQPLLVVGDFNTPNDSVHFRPFRQQLRNAFETAGEGYAATWPVPFPVLQIDFAWHNHLVDIRRCRHGWTRCSDHRPIILELRPNRSGEIAKRK